MDCSWSPPLGVLLIHVGLGRLLLWQRDRTQRRALESRAASGPVEGAQVFTFSGQKVPCGNTLPDDKDKRIITARVYHESRAPAPVSFLRQAGTRVGV